MVGVEMKAGGAVLHGLEHAVEHPGDTATALATDAEHAAGATLHGLGSLGGGILHGIENPLETLSSAEQAVEDYLTGFATGVRDMAQAALLLARVTPGSAVWMVSMEIDPEGTMSCRSSSPRGWRTWSRIRARRSGA
jgi:hypothetical protein